MTLRTSLVRTPVHMLRTHPKTTVLAGVVLVFGAAFLGMRGGESTVETPVAEQTVPSVSVATVASLSDDNSPLMLIGEVRSVSQAELRTKKSGEVTRVYVRAGERVGAGAVLAEVENAAERAAVISAEGAVAAAEAQLAKVLAGARSEDRATVSAQANSALVSLQAAEDSARNAYSQAYTLAQDAIYAKADDFFEDVYTVAPRLRVRGVTFDERSRLERERREIGVLLSEWEARTEGVIPDTELNARLQEAGSILAVIKEFLNDLSAYVSEQEIDGQLTAAEKASQEATMLGARTSVDSARSAVIGARNGLAQAVSAAQVASLNESKTATGARSEDVAAAEAAVTQARGSLASAYAALANTRVRTPIAGTVTSLSVSTGDFVGAQQTVAIVANEGALEVEAFVSDSARRAQIREGDSVRVAGMYDGVVTSVTPGLDPSTKKARVTIGLTEEADLTNGMYVEVAFVRASESEAAEVPNQLAVPISAIKVLPRGLAVFTVTDGGVLEAREITEGAIVGTKMLVEDLPADLLIVLDVRGLTEGDTVTIDNS